MKKIQIYTDGACSGNPGIGGWGAILIYNNTKKEIFDGDANTTNNKMELTAVIKSLESLKEECEIELYTDSKYVKNGITEWIYSWKKNDWKNSKREEVKNKDLWQKLDELSKIHKINWFWVKGHEDNELNNRADELARNGIKKIKTI